jgi:hypothetical protein
VTHFWMWLSEKTLLNIPLMAWLGILIALGMLALATVFILFLVLVDGQIGKPKA